MTIKKNLPTNSCISRLDRPLYCVCGSLSKGYLPDGDMWSKPQTPDDVPEEVGHARDSESRAPPDTPGITAGGLGRVPGLWGTSGKKFFYFN